MGDYPIDVQDAFTAKRYLVKMLVVAMVRNPAG